MKKSKKKLFQNKIALMKSATHGYGVFAEKKMKKGELIEECYFIISRGGDRVLENYYFDVKKRRYALFTGCGSIYNHADEPNADYFYNISKHIARFVAARTIEKGEEILISYGDQWFKDRGYKPRLAETAAKTKAPKKKVAKTKISTKKVSKKKSTKKKSTKKKSAKRK